MLVAVLIVSAFNVGMGVWKETALLFVLTWLYNDLRGSDEIIRDLIIAVAFGMYNHGSSTLVADDWVHINDKGFTWITVVSGIIVDNARAGPGRSGWRPSA